MAEPSGRLESVVLREVWKSEDRAFTPWLAQEDNLNLLANTLGMELELEVQEKAVGPFRADILCKNADDDSWVLIENQIEKTDHKHLGQLLTYASGLQAVNIVWIAEKFTEEHRAAMDWLNKITDDQFRFFGLEIELWRINNSPTAPRFNFVAKPNNWSKSISQASKRLNTSATTETKDMQLRYWNALAALLENDSSIKPQKPRPQHWCNFGIGRSGVNIVSLLNTREKRIGVELRTNAIETSKNFYQQLYQDKEAIEQEMEAELDWNELPENIACRIILYKQLDPNDETNWPAQHAWLKETLEKFDHVFRNRVKNLS